MKTFIFKEDPFNFGHSRSFIANTLYKHLEPNAHSTYDRTIEQYVDDKASVDPVILKQMEDCKELTKERDELAKHYCEAKLKDKRMKEDEVFRMQEEETARKSFEKFKARFVDSNGRLKGLSPVESKRKREHEVVIKDDRPEVGDIWTTKNYLPYMDGPEAVSFRHVDDPAQVMLIEWVDTAHLIVAPVYPKFILNEKILDIGLETWEYHSKDMEGEDFLEYVAFPAFHTIMAEGQLKERSGYSHLDRFMIELHAPTCVAAAANLDSMGPLIPDDWADRCDVNPHLVVEQDPMSFDSSWELSEYFGQRGIVQQWLDIWCAAKLLSSKSTIEDSQLTITDYLASAYET